VPHRRGVDRHRQAQLPCFVRREGSNVGGGVNPEAPVDDVAGTVSHGADEIDSPLDIAGDVEGRVLDRDHKPRHQYPRVAFERPPWRADGQAGLSPGRGGGL
jgi:hypothetical protein